MLNRLLVLAACLVTGAGGLSAANLPAYDFEAQCREGADLGASGDAEAEANLCIAQEKKDQVRAAKLARHASAETVRRCNDIADTGDGGAYSVLAHCLSLEATVNATSKPLVDEGHGAVK